MEFIKQYAEAMKNLELKGFKLAELLKTKEDGDSERASKFRKTMKEMKLNIQYFEDQLSIRDPWEMMDFMIHQYPAFQQILDEYYELEKTLTAEYPREE